MTVYVVICSDETGAWVNEVFENQQDAEEYRKYKEINYSDCGFTYEVVIAPVRKTGERFW